MINESCLGMDFSGVTNYTFMFIFLQNNHKNQSSKLNNKKKKYFINLLVGYAEEMRDILNEIFTKIFVIPEGMLRFF